MKFFLQLIVFCVFTSFVSLSDCDIITMKDGKEIEAKVLEIGIKEIKYKNCDNQEGATISILRKDVFSIKYPNGKKDMLTEINTSNEERRVEGFSITSMILGILGFGVISLIFAIIGLDKIKRNPEKWSGKGFAVTGLILGVLGTIFLIIYLV